MSRQSIKYQTNHITTAPSQRKTPVYCWGTFEASFVRPSMYYLLRIYLAVDNLLELHVREVMERYEHAAVLARVKKC